MHATSLTLLDGYEAAAAAAAAARAASKGAAAAAAAGGGGAAPPAPEAAWGQLDEASTAAASAVAEADERLGRVQSELADMAAKAARLRNVIEWGAAAYGGGKPLPSPEISVLVWPGGQILSDLPRGTTAGDVVQREGWLEVEAYEEGEGGQAGPASALRGGGGGGDGGAAAVGAATTTATAPRQRRLVNVNNCLVDESYELVDGDLLILTGERISNL